jgi:hypothetical protein
MCLLSWSSDNLPLQAEAKKRKRHAKAEAAKMQEASDLDPRQRAVHIRLDSDRWKTTLQISRLLRHTPDFQLPAGQYLKVAVRRVLGKLITLGRAEMKRDLLQKNGRPIDLFRRRK